MNRCAVLLLTSIGCIHQAVAYDLGSSISHRVIMEAFTSGYSLNEDSIFNPGNEIGQIPEREDTLMLRGYFLGRFGDVNISLSPSYKYSRYKVNGIKENYSEFYFQEYNVSYTVNDWKVSLYRELEFWGPSLFSSPSNPFYSSTDQSNPFVEKPAADFIRIDGYHGDYVSSSLIYSYHEGRTVNRIHPFQKTLSFKVDYTSYSYFVGAILSRQDDTNILGTFGQWTVSDSAMLYADIGMKDRSSAYIPKSVSWGVGYDYVKTDSSRRLYTDSVFGVSYSAGDGSTYNLEYRYNQEGYNKENLDRYYDLAAAAHDHLNSAEWGDYARYLLIISSDPGMRTIGRNYLYAQYFKRDVIPELSLNFMLAYDIDSQSSEATAVANYYLNDNIGISGNYVVAHGGKKRGEFSRYIDQVFYIGVKYYF